METTFLSDRHNGELVDVAAGSEVVVELFNTATESCSRPSMAGTALSFIGSDVRGTDPPMPGYSTLVYRFRAVRQGQETIVIKRERDGSAEQWQVTVRVF